VFSSFVFLELGKKELCLWRFFITFIAVNLLFNPFHVCIEFCPKSADCNARTIWFTLEQRPRNIHSSGGRETFSLITIRSDDYVHIRSQDDRDTERMTTKLRMSFWSCLRTPSRSLLSFLLSLWHVFRSRPEDALSLDRGLKVVSFKQWANGLISPNTTFASKQIALAIAPTVTQNDAVVLNYKLRPGAILPASAFHEVSRTKLLFAVTRH
jgi:hypothetical protein